MQMLWSLVGFEQFGPCFPSAVQIHAILHRIDKNADTEAVKHLIFFLCAFLFLKHLFIFCAKEELKI